MSETENKKYKKILCIDGGGIKGVFPSTILAEIEKQIDGNIYEYFDLISGTSTGGIIAIGLALGLTAKDLLNFYETYGPDIFSGYKKSKSGILGNLNKFKPSLNGTLYNSAKLENALRIVFDGYRIGDCKTRIMIPSVNITAGMVHVYKTSHHESLRTDYKVPVVDVALATSAAPVYLQAHKGRDRNIYIDGGIGANNPSGMAVIEGITKCGWNKEDIKLLSIGCLETSMKIDADKAKIAGRQFLNPSIVTDLFMNIESQYSSGIAQLLLGPGNDRYLRINHTDTERIFDMDGATKKLIDNMVGKASEIARYKINQLLGQFFDMKADKFIPIHKD